MISLDWRESGIRRRGLKGEASPDKRKSKGLCDYSLNVVGEFEGTDLLMKMRDIERALSYANRSSIIFFSIY